MSSGGLTVGPALSLNRPLKQVLTWYSEISREGCGAVVSRACLSGYSLPCGLSGLQGRRRVPESLPENPVAHWLAVDGRSGCRGRHDGGQGRLVRCLRRCGVGAVPAGPAAADVPVPSGGGLGLLYGRPDSMRPERAASALAMSGEHAAAGAVKLSCATRILSGIPHSDVVRELLPRSLDAI
jgi:hypothetical protein